MKMKCDIEIVTGFLGSGKTSFINALVESTLVKNEKIIIITCENGNTKLNNFIIDNSQIVFDSCTNEGDLTPEHIKELIDAHSPHRIIIEYNGTQPLENFLKVITHNISRKLWKITTVFFTIEAKTFNIYISNMGNFLVPCIQFSNLILITNTKSINSVMYKDIKDKLNLINPYAHIVTIDDLNTIKKDLDETNLLDNGLLKRFRILMKNLIKNFINNL
ncbi:cobalamin biosynthesis protein [Clostridium botulinum]|uniref:Cobalamin biosynthesis protein n=2 Tax=Clostridium botulinum TaxID=1491 RepID=A0A0A0IIY3_CLOBO|nr:GTP-binding protein [Clostridium botulinum]KGN00187.1 cobalamin biosynthesis protein [Clostridium botulinum C/D str. DC5]KOC51723.1 cobalamin biosynthesis protein [Clostridium botulinum]KOC54803.1 cobalamin biosynthesis protein [Clostridium botulinum]MCD3233529.1 cobalamin biosynthesis protein [Clostridium botulinum D/C]MCD3239279.1 cobalamin biosynthesis protein [Clostridium botulinum D/C]